MTALLQVLCDLGYSAMDIITTLFRVVRNFQAEEFLKLEFIRVCTQNYDKSKQLTVHKVLQGLACSTGCQPNDHTHLLMAVQAINNGQAARPCLEACCDGAGGWLLPYAYLGGCQLKAAAVWTAC